MPVEPLGRAIPGHSDHPRLSVVRSGRGYGGYQAIATAMAGFCADRSGRQSEAERLLAAAAVESARIIDATPQGRSIREQFSNPHDHNDAGCGPPNTCWS